MTTTHREANGGIRRVDPDSIVVQIGNMGVAFDSGTPQATIDKYVKRIKEAPAKHAREEAKRFKAEPPLRSHKLPTVEMLEWCALPEDDPDWIRIPEDVRRAATVELARKRYRAWLKDPKGDPAAANYAPDRVSAALAKVDDGQLARLIESNIAVGARMYGKFAATLVEAWDELERRSAAS